MDFYADPLVDVLAVPITTTTTVAGSRAVHALNIDTKPGAKNLIIAQVEATNPHSYSVGVGRFILRSDGARIVPAVMDNVTPQMHHQVLHLIGWDAAPIPNATYSVVIYAASNNAKPGDALRIEQGYGFLQIMAFGEDTP